MKPQINAFHLIMDLIYFQFHGDTNVLEDKEQDASLRQLDPFQDHHHHVGLKMSYAS